MSMTPPLPEGRFGCILADPPWDWKARSPKGESRSAKRHYRTLPLAEIMTLPVPSVAARDYALFLWIIRPLIFEARAVVEAWGFIGKSIAFVRVKPRKDRQADLFNPERDFPFANGYGTRANAEICLLATRGSPRRLNADVHDVIEAPRQKHSRKPVEIYDRIERLFAGPYLELFARWAEPRLDWSYWGNQADVDAA
jgi:N6-adenosine-specific RNA methylase IME4